MAASMCKVAYTTNLKPSCVYPLLCKTKTRLLLLQKRNKSVEIRVGGSHGLSLEWGSMAKFADGACVAKYGDTAVLATVVAPRGVPKQGTSIVPLTVDFALKYSAAGRIPTNYLKRELGTSDSEIIIGRCIDRSIRSLFPEGFATDINLNCNVLALDGKNDPDIIAINAASAALAISNVPWNGPVGAVRVGLKSDRIRMNINASRLEQKENQLNIIVVADANNRILMIEGDAQNVPVQQFSAAVEYGSFYASKIATEIGKFKNPDKRTFQPPEIEENILRAIQSYVTGPLRFILANKEYDKIERDKAILKLRNEVVKKMNEADLLQSHQAFDTCLSREVKNQILNDKSRCDGRSLTQVRPISAKVDLFKPLHGSALFQRGQTQVFCTVAFDSLQTSMRPDKLASLAGDMKEKHFMLHYEFPGYATNEIKSRHSTSRRELGHGFLAERGLRPVIPSDVPYCIRLTSEVLESNGSSSMASICGGSLALMDAGVNIIEPAAGVAIGLVTDRDEDGNITKHELMDDILGFEDYFGNMDFKVGGTKNGITVVQMDLKIPGIPMKIIKAALERAHKQIAFICQEMTMKAGIYQPRKNNKNNPVIDKITVLPAKRADFVGVGGYALKKMQAETGVTVSQIDESKYEVFAPNPEAMNDFKNIMTTRLEGQKVPNFEPLSIIEVRIVEMRENGVLVELHPNMKPVFLKNSQLDTRQVQDPSVLGFKVGDLITVKYLGKDPVTGATRISRKALTSIASKRMKFIIDNEP